MGWWYCVCCYLIMLIYCREIWGKEKWKKMEAFRRCLLLAEFQAIVRLQGKQCWRLFFVIVDLQYDINVRQTTWYVGCLGSSDCKETAAWQETRIWSLCQEDPLEKGIALQYSCLENPMDGGAWWATVHGVAKRWTRLSDLYFHFHYNIIIPYFYRLHFI